ncbi:MULTISPECIES: S-layer homology domain-containing protein [unclassified Oscillibacter]|uniref:S-layer homology domain-containing protein n=1 Tax=unclassified Oscillibacter TaxID=2629304 RepID=UPI0025E76F90|nr:MULTISPECIES: S-layer homology domain-containing protein [unclassified Oscillibacter]
MKKFLSLVMALVMTMSLVTIGAGATEYKDFTDKSEVQYEEAVAVLNKLGIITGYEGGDFKPAGALTRGAAAKIIVSLMIGSEAAASLQVAAAPYKDVPVTNTFAAVISYCKTAGYINGYSDGTFRPTGALTGFAFAKMLLGALGYKGDIEGFSGSGWTMKVASVGSVAGLYNDFLTPFSGNAGVTREQACQLALNTLKATKVEYKGNNINVTTGDANVSITDQNHTDVVNNSKTDGNIKDDTKMQFAEQHFTDLKQLSDTTTGFGRPATRWAYKNVTIDKFAKKADFTFTAAPSGDTAKDKVNDMGLGSYKVYGGTNVTINDKTAATTARINGEDVTIPYFGAVALDNAVKLTDSSVAQKLVNLTGNGIVVEVYVSDKNADIITNIVVIRTQLMEVNTVSSKTITLKQLDEVGNSDDPVIDAPKYFKAVSSVKDDDDAFADLKNSKAEDYMLVTYAADGTSWSVDSAKAPQVVTGALTAVSRNNSNVVNGVTVGGTAYKLAAIRDDDFASLTASTISSSKKDVTLYLDAYGYATYIEDQGSTSNFMIYGDDYQTLVNGKLVTTLTGWDMKGNDVSITVSTKPANTYYGDLLNYTTSSSTSYDYNVSNVATIVLDDENTPADEGKKGFVEIATGAAGGRTFYEIKAGDTVVYSAVATPAASYTIASGVKTIFVDYDDDNTVKSVSVKNGLANVTNNELSKKSQNNNTNGKVAQMYVNADGAVEAVIVKTTSSDAVSDNVLYVEAEKTSAVVDGVRTYTYHVWVNGAEDDYTSTDKLTTGQFASYAEKADGTYKMSNVTRNDSATSAFTLTIDKNAITTANKSLIYNIGTASYDIKDMYENSMTAIVAATASPYNPGVAAADVIVNKVLNTSGAVFADLTDNGFASMKDIYDSLEVDANDQVKLVIVMNNKDAADNEFKIAAIAVTGIVKVANP